MTFKIIIMKVKKKNLCINSIPSWKLKANPFRGVEISKIDFASPNKAFSIYMEEIEPWQYV